jgi:hypothetical protein
MGFAVLVQSPADLPLYRVSSLAQEVVSVGGIALSHAGVPQVDERALWTGGAPSDYTSPGEPFSQRGASHESPAHRAAGPLRRDVPSTLNEP